MGGEVSWEDCGRRVSNGDSIQFNLRGIKSDNNSAIYVWFDRRDVNGQTSSIFAQRIDDECNQLWDEDILIYNRQGVSIGDIVTDCQGGAIISTRGFPKRLMQVNRNGELGKPLTVSDISPPTIPSETQVNIFPNPANSFISVSVLSSERLIDRILIFDLQGRAVRTTRLNRSGSETVLNLSDLSSGEYIVQVQTSRKSFNRTINILK